MLEPPTRTWRDQQTEGHRPPREEQSSHGCASAAENTSDCRRRDLETTQPLRRWRLIGCDASRWHAHACAKTVNSLRRIRVIRLRCNKAVGTSMPVGRNEGASDSARRQRQPWDDIARRVLLARRIIGPCRLNFALLAGDFASWVLSWTATSSSRPRWRSNRMRRWSTSRRRAGSGPRGRCT